MAAHRRCLPTHYLTDSFLVIIRRERLLIKAKLIEITVFNSASIECRTVRIFIFVAHSHVMMLAFVELILVEI